MDCHFVELSKVKSYVFFGILRGQKLRDYIFSVEHVRLWYQCLIEQITWELESVKKNQ